MKTTFAVQNATFEKTLHKSCRVLYHCITVYCILYKIYQKSQNFHFPDFLHFQMIAQKQKGKIKKKQETSKKKKTKSKK